VTSHLFENEFRRAAPRVPGYRPEWGKSGEGWPDVSKCAARGMAPFSNTRAALACSRLLVPSMARAVCTRSVSTCCRRPSTKRPRRFRVKVQRTCSPQSDTRASRHAGLVDVACARVYVYTCIRVYVEAHADAPRQKRHTRNESHVSHGSVNL